MSRTELATRLGALEQRIISQADAELRGMLNQNFDALRRSLPIDKFTFAAPDSNNKELLHQVALTGSELLGVCIDAMFDAQVDTARRHALEAFMKRMDVGGIQP